MVAAELQELEEVKNLVTKGQAEGVIAYGDVATALREVDVDEGDIEELYGFLEGQQGRLSVKTITDDTAALLWDDKPIFGVGLTLQRLDLNPRWSGLPELDDAGPRAITAYLSTYGPATPEHVHYWLGEGLSAGRARIARWWREVEDQVVEVDVDGERRWHLAEHAADLADVRPEVRVHLLPGKDDWVMGPGTKDTWVMEG